MARMATVCEKVVTVTIAKNETDAVTITTEDGSYNAFVGGYYFEQGYKYYLKSVGKSGDDQTLKYGFKSITQWILRGFKKM